VLVELVIAGMQGVSQALAERFIRGRETSASIRSVTSEVAAIRELQARDRDSLIELKHMLAKALERTDGLAVHRRKVVFTPTERTPDPQAAILNLDLEISRLRAEAGELPGNPAGEAGNGTEALLESRATDPSSIFYQLDEEIAELRQNGGEGR
jgi:hypothetical protein